MGPDDCAGVESIIGERAQKRMVVELTIRATRKAGEIPRAASTDSAYNNITMDKKSSPGSVSGARRQCSHRDGLGELANLVTQPLAC